MHKSKIITLVSTLVLSTSCYAVMGSKVQQASPETKKTVHENAAVGGSQSDKDVAQGALNNDSNNFIHIERLDRSIEQTNKEIIALKMRKQLEQLTAAKKAVQESLGFSVLRIQGFGDIIEALMQMDNGTVQAFKSGQIINLRYKIILISTTQVKMVDLQSKKIFNAPFYIEQPVPESKANVTVEKAGK